jgi:hypothetical protein
MLLSPSQLPPTPLPPLLNTKMAKKACRSTRQQRLGQTLLVLLMVLLLPPPLPPLCEIPREDQARRQKPEARLLLTLGIRQMEKNLRQRSRVRPLELEMVVVMPPENRP